MASVVPVSVMIKLAEIHDSDIERKKKDKKRTKKLSPKELVRRFSTISGFHNPERGMHSSTNPIQNFEKNVKKTSRVFLMQFTPL